MATVIYIRKALEQLGYEYKQIGSSQMAITYTTKHNNTYYFIGSNLSTRNRYALNGICKDKGFTYTILQHTGLLPHTQRIYDPDGSSLQKIGYDEAVDNICKNFPFPVMIKMNKGSQGRHIYKCITRGEIDESLHKIFSRDKNYDYMALAQQCIDIVAEYRVLVYKNKIQFVYLKDNSTADFTGNISPLHFDGAIAVLEKDPKILSSLEDFVSSITQEIYIEFNGMDIARDRDEKLRLIELNGNPGFSIYTRDNGEEKVVNMFATMLQDLE